jgi:hypothetical protein
MKILGLIVILTLAYFNLKDEITMGQVIYFLIGSVITFKGFAMLADPQALLSGAGVVLLGLFVMKPPFIFREKL